MQRPIIVAGSINMDTILQVREMPKKGETIFVEGLEHVSGGKGANQAVAASRLGAEVRFIGKVGQDTFGQELTNYLKKEKLNLEGLKVSKGKSGGAFICVDQEGQNQIILFKGSNFELTESDIAAEEASIGDSAIAVSQTEIPLPTIQEFFSIAKKYNVTTVLNPAPALDLPEELFSKVDIFIVNEMELAFYSGISIDSANKEQVESESKKLLSRGPKIVITTLGEHGSIAVTKDQVIKTPAKKVEVVDTTGAGDCFVGALVTKLSIGVELVEALEFAIKASSLSVTRSGASTSMPYLNEM